MPIYEFRCDSCNKKFDRLCRMGENDGAVCPNCGGKASRIFSTFYSMSASSGGSSARQGSSCSGCTSSNCATCG
ncbi:MAG: zinc ribbon domain-containing protein [Armatimonadetes bacterium]|nr:zinc ribbon domain-containing protein [Armatimonadota bacterium]